MSLILTYCNYSLLYIKSLYINNLCTTTPTPTPLGVRFPPLPPLFLIVLYGQMCHLDGLGELVTVVIGKW